MNRFARRFISLPIAVCATLSVSMLTGCGGAGGTGTGTTGPTAPTRAYDPDAPTGNVKADGLIGRMGVFITASTGGKWDAAWATVLKVELIDVQEKAVTVYDEQGGTSLELTHLAGGKEGKDRKFSLLTVANVPGGKSYIRARITFAKGFELFDAGATTAKTTLLADTVGQDAEQRPVLSFPLERPRDLGNGHEDLVIDFDLSKTSVAGERIVPKLREASGDAVATLSSQEAGTFAGTVGEITGPVNERTFNLTLTGGRTISVQANDATPFYNDGAAPNPELLQGKKITVRGVFDTTAKRVVATEVRTYADNTTPSADTAEATGLASSVNAQAGSFVLTASQVEGLTPSFKAVTVTMASDAVLRSRGGLLLKSEDFYKAVAGRGTLVRVEGTYEPVTGTFKATRAHLEEAVFNPSREVEVKGTPTEADAQAGTLAVGSWTLWQGLAGRGEGKSVPITTTAATQFVDDKGAYLAAANFFNGAKSGEKSVRVVGVYAGGSVTATRLELLPAEIKAVPDAKPGEAKTAFIDERPDDEQNTRSLASLVEPEPTPTPTGKADKKNTPTAPKP